MKKLIAFVYFITLSSFIFAQKPIQFLVDGQAYSIEERMSFWKTHGMSVAIIKEGKIDRFLNWGFADPSTQREAHSTTLYQAGSLSGIVTAVVALKAVEQGKIDLDTDINHYLTSWKLPVNRHTKNDPVTLRDLLTKRRGFTQLMKPKGYLPSETLPSLQQLLEGDKLAKNKAVTVRSGTHEQGNYSFETELILQQLLMDVYQQGFEELMKTQLLDPLNMNSSFFAASLPTNCTQQAAVGFDQAGVRIENDHWIYPELAASGFWTTTEDYAKLVMELLAIRQGKTDGILSTEMIKNAFLPINHSKGLIGNVSSKSGRVRYGGASMGFRTQFELSPEGNSGIVIFMNSYQNWKFMNEAMRNIKKHFEL